METNLGVWIPYLFKDQVTQAIGHKESQREKFLEKLEKSVPNEIHEEFHKCLDKVREFLIKIENVSANEIKEWEKDCKKRWKNHVLRLTRILNNESLRTWYCTGILQTPMIDLWATENEGEFLDTVYEYLSSRQNMPRKKQFLKEFDKNEEFEVLHKWFEDEEKKRVERNVKKQSE